MKAISLWQPWATLWLLTDPDEKVYETRAWYTHHRGPLLVHAAQKRDGEVRHALEDRHFSERLSAHGLNIHDLPFGALIGRVILVNCCRMERLNPWPDWRELQAGNWTPWRYAWQRSGTQVVRFPRPIPYKGAQGLFDVPDSVITGFSADYTGPLFAPREGGE